MNDKNEDYVIGRHPAVLTLKSDRTVNKVFIQEKLKSEALLNIVKLAKEKKIIVSSVPKSKLDLLSNGQNHQGVVLAISAHKYFSVEDILKIDEQKGKNPFLLILDGIEDPHNLGSIIRSADAFGVSGIIIPKRRAVQLTSVVAKTSTGALEYVPIARVNNLVKTVKELKKKNFWIFGTDVSGKDFRQWDANGAVGLVIGNEGKGISKLLKKECDEMLTIKMVGHVQSLNASVAASLLMFQGFSSRL